MARILTIFKYDEYSYNKTIQIYDLEGEALYKKAMIEALKDLECSNTIDELNEHFDEDAQISDNSTLEELEDKLNGYENPNCVFIINMDDNTTIYQWGE